MKTQRSRSRSVIIVSIAVIVLAVMALALMPKRATSPEADSQPKTGNQAQPVDTPQQAPGRYVTLSEYENNKQQYESARKVLFFAASWCPTCRQLDNDLRASLQDIPADLVIIKADYDQETALKKKHGVTYQHTFAQIDNQGSQLKKWNHSATLEDLLEDLGP